jgi:cytochrome c oxidase subunit IV
MKTASTVQWLALLALTALSFGLAESGLSGTAVLVPVLLATLVKGWVVIDRFMGLRQVVALWRWIVLGWLLVVLGLIGYAFRIVLH